jgi:hypothetical protein
MGSGGLYDLINPYKPMFVHLYEPPTTLFFSPQKVLDVSPTIFRGSTVLSFTSPPLRESYRTSPSLVRRSFLFTEIFVIPSFNLFP